MKPGEDIFGVPLKEDPSIDTGPRHVRLGAIGGYVKLEVRCCCTPNNLFGYLKVPADEIMSRRYDAERLDGSVASISLERYNASLTLSARLADRIENPRIRARLREPEDRERERSSWQEPIVILEDEYLAVKSDERPVEWWKGFLEFEEATHEQQREAKTQAKEYRVLKEAGIVPGGMTREEFEREEIPAPAGTKWKKWRKDESASP